jgi:hypothetical protein
MKTLPRRLLLPLLLASHLVPGADFSFFTTLRSGLWFEFDKEIGIGGTSAADLTRTDFFHDVTTDFWANNVATNFQIGYVAATNTGFVSVFNAFGSPTTLSFTNPGPLLNAATTTWTLPAASFFVEAAGLVPNSSISVENLAFSPGVSVLSGSLPASLTASQSGSTVNTAIGSPIVFDPASSGGDWTLSGSIRFSGLIGYGGNASGDALRFGFGASGTDAPVAPPNSGNTPEPSTYLLMGLGLVAARFVRNCRTSGLRL